MSYKIEAPEGAPEWYQPWIVCRVRDTEDQIWSPVFPVVYSRHGTCPTLPWITHCGIRYRYAEPVEVWQPQEGEMVAWDCTGTGVTLIGVWNTYNNTKVARLVYPDNRVVDVSKGWYWLCEHTDTWEA